MSGYEPEFRVIETLRWTPEDGALRLERHLARMARTCSALDLPFPEADLRAHVAALQGAAEMPLRLRLTVDAKGQATLEHWLYTPVTGPWRVAVSAERLDSSDPWLGMKTTRRALYDTARKTLPDGVDEMVFLNERGEVCEGTITNLFVERDGVLLTPALSCGLLPGILREELLDTGRAVEAILTPNDLAGADAFYCGNALRGLIRADLV